MAALPVFVTYFRKVQSGEIVASKMLKLLADIVLERYENPEKWRYSHARANRHIEFIERFCRMPAGRKKFGAPFKLEEWQQAILEVLFGFVDENGIRQYQEILLLIARKNGKTTLAAAVGISMLINDGEGAPQVYFAAPSKDQSNLGFNAAHKMVQMSRSLNQHIKKVTTGLASKRNFGIMRSLAWSTNTLDGLDVHAGIIDELAAHKTRDVYDLIIQGTSSREQPLLFTISTQGFIRNSIMDDQYEYARKVLTGEVEDDRFLPVLYELDDPDEWEDEAAWVKANPGLGTIKKVDYLRGAVAKAKNDPSYLPTVLTKDFNIIQNKSTAWLSISEVMNKYIPDKSFKEMGFRYGVIGIDAANTTDLNAICCLAMRPGDDHIYKKSMYWVPQDFADSLTLEGKGDHAMAPYLRWIDSGYIRTYPGNKVGREVFAEWIRELIDEDDIYPYAIGYDPWGFSDNRTVDELRAFVGQDRFIGVRQGARTMSQPMKELKSDLAAGRIVDWMNPVDVWCRTNAAVKVDTNGNLTLIKDQDIRKRIDGLAAEIDAYIVLTQLLTDYQAII